jgi:hypothetical protein
MTFYDPIVNEQSGNIKSHINLTVIEAITWSMTNDKRLSAAGGQNVLVGNQNGREVLNLPFLSHVDPKSSYPLQLYMNRRSLVRVGPQTHIFPIVNNHPHLRCGVHSQGNQLNHSYRNLNQCHMAISVFLYGAWSDTTARVHQHLAHFLKLSPTDTTWFKKLEFAFKPGDHTSEFVKRHDLEAFQPSLFNPNPNSDKRPRSATNKETPPPKRTTQNAPPPNRTSSPPAIGVWNPPNPSLKPIKPNPSPSTTAPSSEVIEQCKQVMASFQQINTEKALQLTNLQNSNAEMSSELASLRQQKLILEQANSQLHESLRQQTSTTEELRSLITSAFGNATSLPPPTAPLPEPIPTPTNTPNTNSSPSTAEPTTETQTMPPHEEVAIPADLPTATPPTPTENTTPPAELPPLTVADDAPPPPFVDDTHDTNNDNDEENDVSPPSPGKVTCKSSTKRPRSPQLKAIMDSVKNPTSPGKQNSPTTQCTSRKNPSRKSRPPSATTSPL